MGTRTSPKGGFENASKHKIKIPYFLEYKKEDGQFKMDIGWKDVPVTPEDYQTHMNENITSPLRATNGERSIHPYFFQHIPRLPPGVHLSINETQLDVWKRMVLQRPGNEGNALLLETLEDARCHIEVLKIEKLKTHLKTPTNPEYDPVI